METELSNIVPNSKLDTKLLSNNINKIEKKHQKKEINNSKENIKKKTKNSNINYTKSNCLSKLFFCWTRIALRKSLKEALTQEDVCNVSDKQSINYEIKKIKKTFSKYNNSKKLKKFSSSSLILYNSLI